MVSDTLNQAFRESFADVTREQGFEYRDRTEIVPSNNDSAYTFFFMPPQHEDLEWIYKGAPLEGVSSQSTLAMCIRMNNGFTTAGATNRHMKAFEMGHYVERGEKGQGVYHGVELIRKLLPDHANQLYAVVASSDEESIEVLAKLGVAYTLDDNCIYRAEEHHDRTGSRVELKVVSETAEGVIDWELLNIVMIDAIAGKQLKVPIIEAGGSFERVMAISLGTGDVHETPAYVSLENIEQDISLRDRRALKDLSRLAVVLAHNGIAIDVPRDKMETRNKRARAALRELATTAIINDIDDAMLRDHLLRQSARTYYYQSANDNLHIEEYVDFIAQRKVVLGNMLHNISRSQMGLDDVDAIKKISARSDAGSDLLARYLEKH